MKFLVFCFLLGTALASATTATPTIYLSTRTDGLPGSGTQSDPINVSTRALFDAFFKARYTTYFTSNHSYYDPTVFQFLPGTYVANNSITVVSGWQLVGSGQGSTTLRFPATTFGSSSKSATTFIGLWTNWGSWNITVKNLTVDGGVRDGATPLSAGFVMPPARGKVTVTVPSTAKLQVGKWYYVQDTAMTNNKQQWWGIVTCTAINGNSVTLQNAKVVTAGTVTGDTMAGSPIVKNISSTANLEPTQGITTADGLSTSIVSVDSPTQITLGQKATASGTGMTLSYSTCFPANVAGPVLSTAYLFPAGFRIGMVLQSKNVVVQDVTVQDVGVPFYESAAGIELGNQPNNFKVGSGNVIDGCTVQDVFGIYGCYIAANSANNFSGDNGTTEQVSITNNTVLGNGYYLGIGLAGNSDSVVSGNRVSNVGIGCFCDTGYSTGITIENNFFTAATGVHIGVGAPAYFNNSTIKNNVITLTGGGTGIGIGFSMSNMIVTGNTITLAPNSNGPHGIVLSPFTPGSTGIVVEGNQIVSTVDNAGIDPNANEILSPQQIAANLEAAGVTPADTNPVATTTPAATPSTPSTPSVASTPSNPVVAAASKGSGMAGRGVQSGASSVNSSLAMAEKIDRAVAAMAALSAGESKRGKNGQASTGTSTADEQKIVMQLDTLARQMNAGTER